MEWELTADGVWKRIDDIAAIEMLAQRSRERAESNLKLCAESSTLLERVRQSLHQSRARRHAASPLLARLPDLRDLRGVSGTAELYDTTEPLG